MITDSSTLLWIVGAGVGVSVVMYGVRCLRTRAWINVSSDPKLSQNDPPHCFILPLSITSLSLPDFLELDKTKRYGNAAWSYGCGWI